MPKLLAGVNMARHEALLINRENNGMSWWIDVEPDRARRLSICSNDALSSWNT
ncbi:hypothetical protein L2449_09595 [Mesorhizobium muleiense]|nr:hypothetical protein [Mesorhizobium muleiense]MCF6117166.1 hypothetical protein [Mesorhizobium muleiense]